MLDFSLHKQVSARQEKYYSDVLNIEIWLFELHTVGLLACVRSQFRWQLCKTGFVSYSAERQILKWLQHWKIALLKRVAHSDNVIKIIMVSEMQLSYSNVNMVHFTNVFQKPPYISIHVYHSHGISFWDQFREYCSTHLWQSDSYIGQRLFCNKSFIIFNKEWNEISYVFVQATSIGPKLKENCRVKTAMEH